MENVASRTQFNSCGRLESREDWEKERVRTVELILSCLQRIKGRIQHLYPDYNLHIKDCPDPEETVPFAYICRKKKGLSGMFSRSRYVLVVFHRISWGREMIKSFPGGEDKKKLEYILYKSEIAEIAFEELNRLAPSVGATGLVSSGW